MNNAPSRVWSADQVLAIAFERSPNFPPGTDYEYCNTNYALLGVIAEKMEGKPLAQVMKDRLFAPLRMRHALLPVPTVNTLPEPYSPKISYDPANDLTLIVWTNLAVSLDEQQTANALWVKVLDQIYAVSPLAPAPSTN